MADYWNKRTAAAVLEDRGVPVVVSGYEDWTFCVRRRCGWNEHYQRAIARMAARPEIAAILARQAAEPGHVFTAEESATDAAMTREAFAEGCVAKWDGVTGPDGKPMPFNVTNASHVLEHFPDVYEALRKVADDPVKFAPKPEKAKAKAASGN